MASQSVEENIRRACKSFFHYGSLGAFQGDLSLLLWCGFLKRYLAEGAMGFAAVVMSSLLDDPNSVCLVGECRELEEHFGSNYTDAILWKVVLK